MSMTNHPPGGLLRFGLRLPIWLYRAHLGWLLDSRFMMMTTTGRKSGLPRTTVVEILRHDRTRDTYYVASGWGNRSDWYQNLQEKPEAMVLVGRRRFSAQAELLFTEESAQELARYSKEHTTAFRELTRIFLGHAMGGTELEIQTLAKKLPVVGFHPR